MSDLRLFPEGLPIHVEPCGNLKFLATLQGATDVHVYGYGGTQFEAVTDFLESFAEIFHQYRGITEEHLGLALIKEYREMHRWIYGR